ncbi:hypothetical protein QFC19_001990 [Naganishia cerealis]|uniref:Uncharacterized protein n=1 Tax=Naganishia cerealis TaxID=610337 RepID=A0ACC2WEI4_9TREE|nr:hypothetical protein QFC19_001990 [Naganishia cerealis]
MPEHIPRNPEGFEDIDAFFDSPERDESTRSGATSAVTEGDTRRTIASTVAANSTRTEVFGQRSVRVGAKGRLSMMADEDDDAQDHGRDIDGFIDEDVGVNFGDESGSRSMDIVTPSKYSTKTVAPAETYEDEASTARITPSTPMAEQTRRRTPRPGNNGSTAEESAIETPAAVEYPRNAIFPGNRASNGGLSKASRHSLAAPSTAGDVTEDEQELDVQYDDQIDESLLQQPDGSSPSKIGDDGYGDQGDEPEQEAADYDEPVDTNISEEEQIQEQHQENDEGQEEEISPPPMNRKKGKGKAESKGQATAKRKPFTDATNQRKKRTVRPDPDEEDENGDPIPHKKRSRSANVYREPVHKPADEGGVSYLRTARERHKPLDWWRGERPVIKRQIVNGEVGPAFITAEWLTIPEEKAIPLAAKRKGGARRARSGTAEPLPKKGRGKQRKQGSDDEDEEPEADDVTGWDEGTEPGGMVMDYSTGQEVMRRKLFYLE